MSCLGVLFFSWEFVATLKSVGSLFLSVIISA